MSKVLVVAAHPDDEVLGMGGTIARHVREGDEVYVVFMTDGVGARAGHDSPDAQAVAERSAMTKAAADILGFDWTRFTFRDNRMDSIDHLEVIQIIEGTIRREKPDIVYTHHWSDINIDHRITHDATVVACRPQPGCTVRKLLFFEVPSATDYQVGARNEFQPDYFVELAHEDYDKRQAALNVYGAEMRDWPHTRALSNLDRLPLIHGPSVGKGIVERFQVGRIIV